LLRILSFTDRGRSTPQATESVLDPAPASTQSKPTDAEIDVHGLTHVGRVRKENQDHFLVCQLRRRIDVEHTSLPDLQGLSAATDRLAFLAMVADGVGGGARGEEASRVAVEAITKYVAENIQSYYAANLGDDRAFVRALSDAALRCHADLVERSSGIPGEATMATTLTLYIGVWPRAYLVQLGDSRYYLLREGALTQISRDQTIAQDLIDQGVLTRAQGSRVPWADVLSSAIGGSTAKPVVTRIDLDRSFVHLWCSDGLTKHVSDERIAERLRSMTSAKQVCEALLQDALDGGGTDNVTVVVARVRDAVEA
jgi:serine/threonine protein phosphatase PrpC